MYIHMFAFRFKPEVTETKKHEVVVAIRALQNDIPEVLETHVGLNESPRGKGYELGGVMKFADSAGCQRYNAHPSHQKLLSWLLQLIDAIEVDFSSL